jgi:predicted transcriptional regulator
VRLRSPSRTRTSASFRIAQGFRASFFASRTCAAGGPWTVHAIFANIFMPTTVHIPDPLLKSVDRRAKALGISRNRLVVRALEQAVSVQADWSPEFLQRLRTVDRETSTAVDELLTAVTQARRSKEPRDL